MIIYLIQQENLFLFSQDFAMNLTGFARNYFASVVCSCVYEEKDKICKHCQTFEISLNVNVQKICVKEEHLSIDIEYMDFYKYALKKLPGDPFFISDHIRNRGFTRVEEKVRTPCKCHNKNLMAMRIFEISLARCCPCFEQFLFDAIHVHKRGACVLISDFISTRFQETFLIETLEHIGTILFTCFKHLLRVFDFDYRKCYHYKKGHIFRPHRKEIYL